MDCSPHVGFGFAPKYNILPLKVYTVRGGKAKRDKASEVIYADARNGKRKIHDHVPLATPLLPPAPTYTTSSNNFEELNNIYVRLPERMNNSCRMTMVICILQMLST